MDNATLTAEDQAWFQQPVTVQVEQDNRNWLDEMLKMKREELINYAVYQYGLPEQAAEAVERNDLIQMIVVANRAGGGQSVSQKEYIYIPELKGILEPAVSLRDPKDNPLFLSRGAGANKQVFDKLAGEWRNLDQLLAAQPKNVAADAADQADNTAGDSRTVSQAADHAALATTPGVGEQQRGISLDALMSVLPKLNRKDLTKIASDLGIEDGDNVEKFPANKDLIAAIEKQNELNKQPQ